MREQSVTLQMILDIFEWFDSNANGKIEYSEFETKLAQFLYEDAQNSKKAAKKAGKSSKKGGKKSNKKKK